MLRLAIAIVIVLIVVGVVAGEKSADKPAATLRDAKAPEAPVNPATEKHLGEIARRTTKRETQDLFASRSWASPPPAAPVPAPAPVQKVAPAPAPSAPPLPYKYLGLRSDADRIVVYLAKGEETYNAVVGDTLDNAYRIESISESAVQFSYLPLGTLQSLNITRPQ